MNYKRIFLFIFLITIFSGIGIFVIESNKKFVDEQQKERVEKLNERARMYVHSWNIAAYANGSQISFHGNINSEGDYVFTAVNIVVDFSSEEDIIVHEVLAFKIRDEWNTITSSKLIRFFDPDGVMIIWTDLNGNFFSCVPEKEEPKEKKRKAL